MVSKYSERERRGFVAKWRASGLTQAEFCRREGIKEWELSTWKRSEQKIVRNGKPPEPDSKRVRRIRREAEESEEFWRAHVLAHAKSGLRRGEYCKQHGLSINTFKRWRAKFVDELRINSQLLHLQMANPFVEVQVPAEPKAIAAPDETLEMILPGGARVVVSERTPFRLLSKLLKAIQELPC